MTESSAGFFFLYYELSNHMNICIIVDQMLEFGEQASVLVDHCDHQHDSFSGL